MTRPGPLGVHLTLGSGYEQALEEASRLGITCCQLFTHNPRGWQFAPLDEERLTLLRSGFKERSISPVVSHCNYLINLGATGEIREKSIACLQKEFEYAAAFGCDHFVLHVGKHKDATLDEGIRFVAEGIMAVREQLLDSGVTLLLETVAGQGTEIGARFDDLARVIALLPEAVASRVGVCLDTCHVFAAGYDLRTREAVEQTLAAFDESIGLDRLKVLHLNDSLKGLGEKRDRHVHIGRGSIGEKGFAAILHHPRLRPLPKVLETPWDEEREDLDNLTVVRRLEDKKRGIPN